MTLDATVGGIASNTYVIQADADAFFLNHYSAVKTTAWAALTAPQKESVLLRACQVIDSLRVLDNELGSGALPIALVQRNFYDLQLHRLEPGQLLNFPRNIDLLPNSYSGFIPQQVMDAQCEQAVYLLSFDDSVLSTRLAGISRQTVAAGSVRVSQQFSGAGFGGAGGGTYIAPLAIELMRPFLRYSTRVHRS